MGAGTDLINLPPLTGARLSGEFWVAKNGDDANGDGSKLNPFLSIQKAYDTSASDALINVMPGDYTEDLLFDGNKSTRILIKGVGVEDQHRTKIIGFHTFVNSCTRISFEDLQFADGGTLGNIFDLSDSDGRHYYKNTTFNLTNGGSRPLITGNGTANWHIFHDCTMAGEIDTSIGALTGTPSFYFQECTGGYGIIQSQGVTVTAVGCVVAPYVDHRSGFCTIHNADFSGRDGTGHLINSSAILAAGNRVALRGVNTWSNTTNDYAKINIPLCAFFLDDTSRDRIQDTLIEANRVSKGLSAVDLEMHLDDDQLLTLGDSDEASLKYDGMDLILDVSIGAFNINTYVGINMAGMEKHSLAIGDPVFDTDCSYINVFSTTAKIQAKGPADNGLVGCLLDITTEDTPVDVTSPAFALLKMRATNEQDIDTSVGNMPFFGFDCIVTQNGNMQGQPFAGFLDNACNFKITATGDDQEMANFTFHSMRGINGEAINSQTLQSGTPIFVQLGADLVADASAYTEDGGGAIVWNQVGVQGRCFGHTEGTLGGTTSTGGFFSASGGKTNIGLQATGDYSKFNGDLGVNVTPTETLEVKVTDSTKIGLKVTGAAGQAANLFLVEDSGNSAAVIIDSAGNTRINNNWGFGVAPSAVQVGYSFTNDLVLRSYNANTVTLASLADFVATQSRDLIAKGILSA